MSTHIDNILKDIEPLLDKWFVDKEYSDIQFKLIGVLLASDDYYYMLESDDHEYVLLPVAVSLDKYGYVRVEE